MDPWKFNRLDTSSLTSSMYIKCFRVKRFCGIHERVWTVSQANENVVWCRLPPLTTFRLPFWAFSLSDYPFNMPKLCDFFYALQHFLQDLKFLGFSAFYHSTFSQIQRWNIFTEGTSFTRVNYKLHAFFFMTWQFYGCWKKWYVYKTIIMKRVKWENEKHLRVFPAILPVEVLCF